MKRILFTILLLLVAGVTFAQTYPRKCTEEDIPSSERQRYYDEAKKHVTNYYLQIPAAIGDLDNREVLIDAIMATGQSSLKPEFLLDGIKGLTPVSPDQYFSKLDTQYKYMVDEMEFQVSNISVGDIMMKTGVSCYIPVEYDLALMTGDRTLFKRKCRMYCLFPRLAASKLIKTMQVEPVKEILAYQPLGKEVGGGKMETAKVSGTATYEKGKMPEKVNVNKEYTDMIIPGANYSTIQSMQILLEDAVNGIVGAQYQLGRNYYLGDKIIKDKKNAVKWFTEAANQGHRDAQYLLGYCYETGQGVKKNLLQAFYLYEKCGVYKDVPERMEQMINRNNYLREKIYSDRKQGNQKCVGKIYGDRQNKTEILVGASVFILNTGAGIVTDINGEFILEGLKDGDIICVEFIGYEKRYYQWSSSMVGSSHKFTLHEKKYRAKHKLKQGQTINQICKYYDITLEQLESVNPVLFSSDSDNIEIGKILNIPYTD